MKREDLLDHNAVSKKDIKRAGLGKLLSTLELDCNILEMFQQFLKIPIDTEKKLSEIAVEKQIKYCFLYQEIITNRFLGVNFRKSTYYKLKKDKGHEMCSSYLARVYNRHSTTVQGWIRTLVKQGVLKVVRSTWAPKAASKTYRMNRSEIMEFCNKYNGFKDLEVNEFSDDQLESHAKGKIGLLTYTMKDAVRLCACYIGRQEQLNKDLEELLPVSVLSMPREHNMFESKVMDFYYAFNYVHRFHQLTWKYKDRRKWKKFWEDKGVPINFNWSVLHESPSFNEVYKRYKKDVSKFLDSGKMFRAYGIEGTEHTRLKRYIRSVEFLKKKNLSDLEDYVTCVHARRFTSVSEVFEIATRKPNLICDHDEVRLIPWKDWSFLLKNEEEMEIFDKEELEAA